MNKLVGLQWHFTLLDLLAYLLKLTRFLVGFVRTPIRQRQLPAGAVHIAHDEPGNRGNLAVPRPGRLGRMAVGARSVQYRGYLRTHMRISLHRLSLVDCRIGLCRADRLTYNKKHNQAYADPLECTLHWISISLYPFARA